MSKSRDYRCATDPLTSFVSSLSYRELQKKCSSVNLQATGPQDVLMNRYLNYLRSNNCTIVAGNNSKEPTLLDGARAPASTSRSNASTPSTQTISDISSDADNDEATTKTPPVQGQKRGRKDSEAATTRPRLKHQKTDNQPYQEYICPITLVSAAVHTLWVAFSFVIFSFPSVLATTGNPL